MRAFVFPGQGSQKIGMGKNLAEAYSSAREVFAEIDDALDQNLSRLMWSGDEQELTLTENAQPALMSVSMAIMAALRSDGYSLDQMAGFVAGHSLGEYSALCAAGGLKLKTTARLLKLRGQAMQRAVPVGVGSMAAIIGLSRGDIDTVLEEASDAGIVVAANDNADGQIVISGVKEAVEKACVLAKTAGAKRALALPVSAPFHSPLMEPARIEMAEALESVEIHSLTVPLITNITAQPVRCSDTIRALLIEQVTGAVRWRETVASFADLGVDTQVETGAGKVLSGLVRRIDRDINPISLETPVDIESFAKTL